MSCVSGQRLPPGRAPCIHLGTFDQPAALPTAQLRPERVGVVDKAEQQREIHALVVGHIIYVDRACLDEDAPSRSGRGSLPRRRPRRTLMNSDRRRACVPPGTCTV